MARKVMARRLAVPLLISILIATGVDWSPSSAEKLKPEDLKLGRGELGHEHPKGYTVASSFKIDKDPATGLEQLWITYRAVNGGKGDATIDWCSSGYRFRFVKPGTVERQHIHFPYDGIWKYMNWVAPLDCGMLPGEAGAVIESDVGSESIPNAPAHVPTSRVVLFHAKHVPSTPLRWIIKAVYEKQSAGLEFTSTVERTARGGRDEFKYSYTVRNSLKQPMYVQWSSLADAKSPLGLILDLPPEGTRNGSWTSTSAPMLINDVAVFNAKGNLPGDRLRIIGIDPDRSARRLNLKVLRTTENEFLFAPAFIPQDSVR
jgi:hypothetical protein